MLEQLKPVALSVYASSPAVVRIDVAFGFCEHGGLLGSWKFPPISPSGQRLGFLSAEPGTDALWPPELLHPRLPPVSMTLVNLTVPSVVALPAFVRSANAVHENLNLSLLTTRPAQKPSSSPNSFAL